MKYKLAVSLFSTTVIAISIYAILSPSYDLGLFVNLGRDYARVRVLLALLVATYVLIPVMRLKIAQLIMFFGGGLLLALGLTTLFSPMLFGHLSHYTALGDVVMAVEGGTISMIAALQLKTKKLHLAKLSIFTPAYNRDGLYPFKSGTVTSQSRTMTSL